MAEPCTAGAAGARKMAAEPRKVLLLRDCLAEAPAGLPLAVQTGAARIRFFFTHFAVTTSRCRQMAQGQRLCRGPLCCR